MLQQTLLHPLT
jgi:transcription factor TGA